MNADLEWHEPTAEDFAKWEWSRLFPSTSTDAWDKLPPSKRRDLVKLWEHSAKNSAMQWRAAAYTLARAVEYERAVEEAWGDAQADVEASDFTTTNKELRALRDHRDNLGRRHTDARARVSGLVAKILGRQP